MEINEKDRQKYEEFTRKLKERRAMDSEQNSELKRAAALFGFFVMVIVYGVTYLIMKKAGVDEPAQIRSIMLGMSSPALFVGVGAGAGYFAAKRGMSAVSQVKVRPFKNEEVESALDLFRKTGRVIFILAIGVVIAIFFALVNFSMKIYQEFSAVESAPSNAVEEPVNETPVVITGPESCEEDEAWCEKRGECSDPWLQPCLEGFDNVIVQRMAGIRDKSKSDFSYPEAAEFDWRQEVNNKIVQVLYSGWKMETTQGEGPQAIVDSMIGQGFSESLDNMADGHGGGHWGYELGNIACIVEFMSNVPPDGLSEDEMKMPEKLEFDISVTCGRLK
jgi:heme/copper-type cytochrome/quinol oxidase subunit 4